MLTAADIMTTEITAIRETSTVREARAALQELDVRHLPVINEVHEVVGMLSDRDLAPLGEDARSERRVVADLMSGDVVAVDPTTDLDELIDSLTENRIGAVPVIDPDGHLAGLVSYIDVLRAVSREHAESRGEAHAAM